MDTWQIVILLLDYFTKTVIDITYYMQLIGIVQEYNGVIASCALSARLINEYKESKNEYPYSSFYNIQGEHKK